MLNASYNTFKKDWNMAKTDETIKIKERYNNKKYSKTRGHQLISSKEKSNQAVLRSFIAKDLNGEKCQMNAINRLILPVKQTDQMGISKRE
jgi:hypothetical protein